MALYIVFRWFFAVICAFAVVYTGCRMYGKDMKWIGRHLWLICIAVFGVAYAEEYAQKPPVPPPPPTVRGITLEKPMSSTAGISLKWNRDDGSNSVGRVYAVEQRQNGSWNVMKTVEGETEAEISGFLIDEDREWRIREVNNND